MQIGTSPPVAHRVSRHFSGESCIHALRMANMHETQHAHTLNLAYVGLPHLEELHRRRGGVHEHHAQAARRVHAGVGASPAST